MDYVVIAVGALLIGYLITDEVIASRKDAAEKRRQEEARLLEASLPRYETKPKEEPFLIDAVGNMDYNVRFYVQTPKGPTFMFTVLEPFYGDDKTKMLVKYPDGPIEVKDRRAFFDRYTCYVENPRRKR